MTGLPVMFRLSRRMRLRMHRLAERLRHWRRKKALDRMRGADLTSVRVAYHEAGHALVQWHSPFADRGLRIAIHSENSGTTSFLHCEPDGAHSSWWLLALKLGGLAAESLRFRDLSLQEDDIAGAIVIAYGMLDSARVEAGWERPALSPLEKKASDELLALIDPALLRDDLLRELLVHGFLHARLLLSENDGATLDDVAALAFQKKWISGMHVRRIAGERPPLVGPPNDAK